MAAAKGVAEAWYNAALLHDEGGGLSGTTNAGRYCESASERVGMTQPLLLMSLPPNESYISSETNPSRRNEFVNEDRAAAELGYADAQFTLAMMLAKGDEGAGVAQDAQEALLWARKAADQGVAAARCFVWGMFCCTTIFCCCICRGDDTPDREGRHSQAAGPR